MPTSRFETANLAANARSANILAGDINEFVPYLARVTLYTISSAANIHVTIFADSDVVSDNKEIVAIGTTLSEPDHMFDSFIVAPGTRLAVFYDERGGVATTDVLLAVDVTPL